MRKPFVFIVGFLLTGFSALSQQDSSALLEKVIITSQRKAKKELLVPYSTQVVSRVQLANYQPRSTPEALAGTNGVFIQKTNHGGGSPFIRGFTGNQVLILVDGIRLNNSTFRYGPNQYLNTIDAYSLQKIEVVKGTGSVQYGSDALGGVIQVFTRDPQFTDKKHHWDGMALGKIMTGNMEKTARAEAAYHAEKTAVHIGATYRDFGDLIGGDTTGKQTPSGYKEYAFDAKVKFKLQPRLALTLASQFLQQQHVPVYHKVVLENFAINEFEPQQRLLNYARLNYTSQSKWLNAVELTTSWQQTIEGRASRKNGSSNLLKERDKINTIGITADISSVFTNAWTANTGVEVYLDKINSTKQNINTQNQVSTLSRGLYPDDARYGNYSVYSLHHISFNKWLLETGVRFNAFAINITDTSLGKVKITPSSFVYNAALMYNLSQTQHIYATFNSGYRAPNIDDMGTLGIVDFRYEVPAFNLKPERSRNIELGYKMQVGKWSGTLSAYYMHINNLITRVKTEGQVINGYPVYQKENVEEAYLKGFEAELAYTPINGWEFKANIANIYGQNLTKHEPLRRIPPVNGKLMARYNKNRWFAATEFLYAAKQDRLAQGDKDDNRIPKGGTPGWDLLNLYAGCQFAHVKFNIGLQNLFNEDYRTHGSGINGVGRSAWLSVAVFLP